MLLTATVINLLLGGAFPALFSNYAVKTLNLVFGITIVLMIVVLVLENDNPIRTIAWILVLLYLPVVGFIFYLLFGRNWRKSRLFSRKGLVDSVNLGELLKPLEQETDLKIENELAIRLISLLESNSKAILTRHNRVRVIPDTAEAFEEICTAIDNAQRHIHMEYFSISADAIGNRIKDLLLKKADQGIQIRFIYDDVGCWSLRRSFKSALRKAGVMFVPFMPVWIPFLNSRANYRNHRKLVIVDGRTVFLGGLNIADKYMGKDRYFGYWRDSMLVLEGDAAIAMQGIFLTDWYFVSRQNLMKTEIFRQYACFDCHHLEASYKSAVQIAASGPDSDHASIMQVYFAAISNARQSIRISTPYLILNDSLLMALKTAAMSGCRVDIILPSKPDHFVVFWGSRSYYQELLDTGIHIWEYQHGFMHAKVLIIDDEILSIGTANMDLRSFNHNFELAALIYDPDIAMQAARQFETDLAQSRLVDPEAFRRRSIVKKSVESVCRLFSPVL
ncbi:MAG: cardiolipin synthase [Candidatus Cloacimonadaceae bacterium]|nr:cardiolipin synthase [Candidatus Cloacimonadaceae bacterium]